MIIPNKFNGYNRDGTRQYHKGGDGGAKAARQQEEQRQARVQSAVDEINAIFDSKPVTRGVNQARAYDPNMTYYDARGNAVIAPKLIDVPTRQTYAYTGGGDGGAADNEFRNAVSMAVSKNNAAMMPINDMLRAGQLFTGIETTAPTKTREQMYAEQKQAVLDLNKRDIDRQFKEAERQNRFGLARSGLMGGSADIESNAELQEKTGEGMIKAAALADGAAADLKTQDERTRQSLISMAQSGIDTGTAQTMALRGLDANAQAAQGARQGSMVGSLFNDMSQAYLMRQMSAGMNAGRNQNQQWYGVSAPQQTYGGSTYAGA